MSTPAKKSLGEFLQTIDRRWLYLILFVLCSAFLFVPVTIPTKPDAPIKDLYVALMETPQDKPVFVQSDWTVSTQGENALHFEALLRILMRRDLKFALYSAADPQAPQVARNVLQKINAEREAAWDANLALMEAGNTPPWAEGELASEWERAKAEWPAIAAMPEGDERDAAENLLRESLPDVIGNDRYIQWEDYVDIGLFTDLASMANALTVDVRKAWSGRKSQNLEGIETDIFESPVLANVERLEDIGLLMNVTASATIDILIQRLPPARVRIGLMCTGVVGPQMLPYYQSKQLVGVGIGLKGAYDLEYLMEYGLNADGPTTVKDPNRKTIEPFTGHKNFARARDYYGTLHVALTLLILGVVLGNVGMFLSPKKRGRGR